MILVTGGAGFIGSNICAALNEDGLSDLVIADELGSDGKWRNIAKRSFRDIVFPGEIAGFLEGKPRLTHVIHMGANSSTTAVDADEIVSTNFRLSARLWQWCTETRTPFIYASSAATYGDGTAGFEDDETDVALSRLTPLNLYGWSKHAFDRWALQRVRENCAPPQWVGLKFFNVFGPNEYHKGSMQSLVAKYTRLVSEEQPINLFKSHRKEFADGGQLRDFVYVKDCCAVISWLIANPSVCGLFNLGTGQARTFTDLINGIGLALGKGVEFEFVNMPELIRSQYQYYTQANIAKLRGAGFQRPFSSLETAVADYVKLHLATDDPYR